jgi:hypothetical protein
MARRRVSDAKKGDILERIESIEQSILKAKEYLESGKHADWAGFRPLFVSKPQPPHKDWVKNVFLARTEKALRRAEKVLGQVD